MASFWFDIVSGFCAVVIQLRHSYPHIILSFIITFPRHSSSRSAAWEIPSLISLHHRLSLVLLLLGHLDGSIGRVTHSRRCLLLPAITRHQPRFVSLVNNMRANLITLHPDRQYPRISLGTTTNRILASTLFLGLTCFNTLGGSEESFHLPSKQRW